MVIHLAANDFAMQPVNINELPQRMDGIPYNAFYTKIAPGEYFMMGDNRDHSNDSRFWGTVPYSLIVGKPWFIYFSWNDDYEVRWERMFRFISTVEHDMDLLKSKDGDN